MLESVALKNFKLHADTSLKLKPITLLIGPNNSGKSSLFQSLQVARQSFSGKELQLVPPSPSTIDVGTFQDVCRKGENTLSMAFKGFFVPANLAMIRKGIEKIDVHYRIQFQSNKLIHHQGEIVAGEYALAWEWNRFSGGSVSPQYLRINGFTVSIEATEDVQNPLLPAISESPPGTPIEARAEIRNLVGGMVQAPSDLIASARVVYGLRGFERVSYDLLTSPSARMEKVLLHERATSMANQIAYNRELEERLSEWFSRLLGVRLRVDLVDNRRITIEAKRDILTSFANEGLGLHQLLFILIPVALSQPYETVCMDDPAAHLHPKAQSDLVSLLLRIYREEHKQYIIATHSEHVLFSFLTAVARREISN
jgi:predicted ATPase